MNEFDNIDVDQQSFSWADLIGQNAWSQKWTASFTSLTTVGALTVKSRFRIVGAACEFQVQVSAATSIASTAGTTYFALPIAAKGVAGIATMSDDTSKVAVGTCHIDAANSRCYLPAQSASGHTFTICGSCEI